MSTSEPEYKESLLAKLPTPPVPNLESARDALTLLVNELKDVDENNSLAALNETTISDNNGGRIELSEDPDDPDNLKKQGLEPNGKSKPKST